MTSTFAAAKSASVAAAIEKRAEFANRTAAKRLAAVVEIAIYNMTFFGTREMAAELEADRAAFTLEVKAALKAA